MYEREREEARSHQIIRLQLHCNQSLLTSAELRPPTLAGWLAGWTTSSLSLSLSLALIYLIFPLYRFHLNSENIIGNLTAIQIADYRENKYYVVYLIYWPEIKTLHSIMSASI